MDELSKLRWQCRRGTKELDLLLSHYLENRYQEANAADKHYFLELLEQEDSELMAKYDSLADRLIQSVNS